MRRLISVLALSCISACSSPPGSYTDVHSGVRAFHSGEHEVVSGLLKSMDVAAFAGEKDGELKYGILFSHLSTGIGWSFFERAWSFGKEYELVEVNREVLGCSSGCTHLERAVFELTRDEFMRASQNGFEFKLEGKNRSEVARVPTEAFKEVLDQMERIQTQGG